MTADGRQLSKHDALGDWTPSFMIMGDVYGGLIKPTYRPDHAWSEFGDSLSRFAGPTDLVPWRYAPPGWFMGRPAQANDGTIYIVEQEWGTNSRGMAIHDLSVAIIDGDTGRLIKRVLLPRNVQVYQDNRAQVSMMPCSLTPMEYDAGIGNLMIGADGRAYYVHRNQTNNVRFNGSANCGVSFVSRQTTLTLMAFSRNGMVGSSPLITASVSGCANLPVAGRLFPDMDGGVIATAINQNICTNAFTPGAFIHTDSAGTSTVYPNSEGLELQMVSSAGRAYLTPFNGGTTLTAKTISGWTTNWATNASGLPMIALADGGVVTESGLVIDRDGTIVDSTPLALGGAASVARDQEFTGTRFDQSSQQTIVASVSRTTPIKAEASFSWGVAGSGNFSSQGAVAVNCVAPPAHPKFRSLVPGSMNFYYFDQSYQPWTAIQADAVREAFRLWDIANTTIPQAFPPTPLGTQFAEWAGAQPPTSTQAIILKHVFMPPLTVGPAVGAIPAGEFGVAQIPPSPASWDGYLTPNHGLDIKFNTDPHALSSADGFLKTALHEIGHLMGFGENYTQLPNGKFTFGPPGSTVMNPTGGPNDVYGLQPKNVTSCDQAAARVYAFRTWP